MVLMKVLASRVGRGSWETRTAAGSDGIGFDGTAGGGAAAAGGAIAAAAGCSDGADWARLWRAAGRGPDGEPAEACAGRSGAPDASSAPAPPFRAAPDRRARQNASGRRGVLP